MCVIPPQVSRWLLAFKTLCGFALFAAIVAALPAPVFAVTPCTDPPACRTTLAFEGGRTLTLLVSAAFDQPQPDIRRAIVVVHGTEGNADGYFRTMNRAAAMARKDAETLIIAPRFAEEGDPVPAGKGELFWNRGADWRAGDLSSRDHQPRVSSFDIMDRILARLADENAFPNLSAIVLAGHSAGAQFVQRYALAQPEDPALAPKMLYLVANPSSFLYLDARRPDPAQPGAFRVPVDDHCETNRFKYGFERANAYFQRESPAVMIERYRGRRVAYLLGDRDTDPQHKALDRRCAAMAQGATRFARVKAFEAYMDAFHQPHAHGLVTVPNVGHSARGMFQSPQGLKVLFE